MAGDVNRARMKKHPMRPSAAPQRGGSPGQAVVEAALAFLLLVRSSGGSDQCRSTHQLQYRLGQCRRHCGLRSRRSRGRREWRPIYSAVSAVNQEQGVLTWSACGSPVVAPCVSTSAVTHSTGSSTSVTVEQVTLHGSFQPVLGILGITLPGDDFQLRRVNEHE